MYPAQQITISGWVEAQSWANKRVLQDAPLEVEQDEKGPRLSRGH